MLSVLVQYLQEKMADNVFLRYLTSLYVLIQTKQGHQIYCLMKGHYYILQDQYLFLPVHLLQKKCQGTKYGNQNLHFF